MLTYNRKIMEDMVREQANKEKPVVQTPWEGMAEEHRRMVLNYASPDGTLKIIPGQSKKLLPILDYVSGGFEKGAKYNEKEVNDKLRVYSADTSSLRRYLVDYGYLQRSPDGSRYWRK